jgi:pimeloyl-ACP methyl ester carboxylesterase
MGARTALHLSTVDDRVRGVVAMGVGELSLANQMGGMGLVPDALRTDDPDSIEHAAIRHFREMADAIHADREALADLMAATRSEVPSFVEDVTVPVLVVTGSDDVNAGPPGPLAERLADGEAVLTAGDHAGVKDQPDAHRAIVDFLGKQA